MVRFQKYADSLSDDRFPDRRLMGDRFKAARKPKLFLIFLIKTNTPLSV
jgi:hypothetical protein